MGRTSISVLRPMLCILSLGLLLAGCQKEATGPVSPTIGTAVVSPLQKVSQRPISDFLSTQVFATFWTTPNSDLVYGVDFAGALDRILGLNLTTTFDGSVTERALNDGTAEVNVDIRSHNVVTWIFDGVLNVRVFGMDPWSVQGGATPTLGDVHFKCTLINSAPGAALPSIFDANITRMTIEASAFGPLTAAAGLGPDGTPGHGWINQVGLLTKIHGRLAVDLFPAEVLKLQRVGN